jgi:predicted TIM-barrel fold metal-dependent hydrolase
MRTAFAFLLLAALSTAAVRPKTEITPAIAYHQHLLSPATAELLHQPQLDGTALVKLLDKAGIRHGVVLSMGYTWADERKGVPDPDRHVREENDWTSQQIVRSKGRLIGFCSVNPLRDAALAEIDRCLRLPGIVGLKLHFANSGVSLRNAAHVARLEQVFAEADARHAPIIVHMRARTGSAYGAEEAQVFIDKLLSKAPDVVVQVAHLAGSGAFPQDAQEAMRVFAAAIARHDPRTRNLYFDQATCAMAESTLADGASIAAAIRSVGVKRVLFGSDLPVAGNPAPAESWAIFRSKVPLTDAEFRTIANNRAPYIPNSWR